MKVPEKNAGGGAGVDGYGKAFDGGSVPPPHPTGTVNAVCVDYVDMGEVECDVYGKPGEKKMEHRAKFVYQSAKTMPDGRRYLLAFKPFGVKVSLHEKASFRQHLEAFAGRTFAVGEDIDPESFVGQPCVLIVTHSKNQDGTRTYANIDSVGPHMDGLPVLEPEGYVRIKDRPATSAAPAAAEPETDEVPF